jgi:aspartyl protease family protein
MPPRSPLRVVRCPPRGRCACGPAKPVPRPLLDWNARRVCRLVSFAAHALGFIAFFLLTWNPAGAQAESVALAGMMGNKALLVVNGTAPKTVAPGETHQGVKVMSTSGDQAVIEQAGKRQTLRVGEAPVSMGASHGASGRGSRIVLAESSGGHFMTAGQINGRAVQFMVDTGATSIAMSMPDAERAGINFKNGVPVQLSTANGAAHGFRIKLNSVRVGDVEVYDVDAVVTPQPMPFVLLGNSFLTRFQMKRDNNVMTLDKRY